MHQNVLDYIQDLSTRCKADNQLKAAMNFHMYVRHRCECLDAPLHPVPFETHTVSARGSYLSDKLGRKKKKSTDTHGYSNSNIL